MRVAVFGAAGALGRRVLSQLIASDKSGIDYILAGDCDTRGLSDLHASLGHLGIAVRYLEAEEPRSFAERMSACDAVISCLGGRGTDEFPLAMEAVERGLLYLSSGAENDVFLRREKEGGRSRGGRGTAVMGLGWSPGLSNLLAAHLGSRFRRLDALSVYWCSDAREMSSPGGLEELMRVFGGRCHGYREGRLRVLRAGSWEERVAFPPGSQAAWVSHARGTEPLILPSLFPEVLTVQVKGGLAQESLRLPVHTLSWVYSLQEGAHRDLLIHAAGLLLKGVGPPESGDQGSALLVEARGVREEERGEETVGATGSRLQTTAVLLVWALSRLSARPVSTSGIFSPEEVLGLAGVLPALRFAGVRFWRKPRTG